MTKIEKSSSAAMLRSMSMGHHGKALLRKMDIDSLSTRERVFPSTDDDPFNVPNYSTKNINVELTDSERRRENRRKKIKKIVKSAVGNEFSDLTRLMENNKKNTESTSSMLDSLSHIVKSLRHKAREALAEEEIDFIDGARTKNVTLHKKTVERAKRLAKRLPNDLKDNLKKVVQLHKSASMDSSMLRNTKRYNTYDNNNNNNIQNSSNNNVHYNFDDNKINSKHSNSGVFLELPRLSLSRITNNRQHGMMSMERTPSVYGRLLDEQKFTGVYKERFNDFQRDYFDTHRMQFRPSFTRMVNNRTLHKEKEQTSRGKFKQNLRPNVYNRIPGCTF